MKKKKTQISFLKGGAIIICIVMKRHKDINKRKWRWKHDFKIKILQSFLSYLP